MHHTPDHITAVWETRFDMIDACYLGPEDFADYEAWGWEDEVEPEAE